MFIYSSFKNLMKFDFLIKFKNFFIKFVLKSLFQILFNNYFERELQSKLHT